jgi:hypothetical protein
VIDMVFNTLFGLTGSPDAMQVEDQANELLRRLQMASEASAEGREASIPFGGMAVQRPTAAHDRMIQDRARADSQGPQTIAPSIDSNYVDMPSAAQTSGSPVESSATTRPQPQVSSAPPARRAGPFPVPAAPSQSSAPVLTAQSPDFSPSFGERMQHFGNALTGRETGSLEEQMRGRKTAYDAMISMGADPALAKAAAMNPKILEAMMISRLGNKSAPEWGVIGEDRFGKKQYGFIDRVGGKVTPYGDTALADGSGVGDDTQTGEAYLKTLPTQEATQVKALVEGRLRPPPMGRKNPYWEQLLAKAGQYEPGFDMTKFAARQATRTDFDKGKAAGNIKALNTVMGHLDSMDKAIAPLGNFTMLPGPMNYAKDIVRNNLGDEDYQRARANFRLAKGAVASELMKVFRETGGSVTEVKDWEEKIHENDSPAALKETVKSAIELIGSRLNAVNDQWNRTMNVERPITALLSPTARKVWDRLHPEAAGEAPAAEAPVLAKPEDLRGVPKQPPANARRSPKDGRLYIPNPNKPGTWLPWLEE